MLLSWLFKFCLLAIAGLLLMQWFIMMFKVERSLNLFGITFTNASGHNMILGNIGGMILGTAVMSVLFVVQSKLWMYPLMLMSICTMLGRAVSIAQKGVNPISIVGVALELLGLLILLLFYTGVVLY